MQYILDTVVKELAFDASREKKFIQVRHIKRIVSFTLARNGMLIVPVFFITDEFIETYPMTA